LKNILYITIVSLLLLSCDENVSYLGNFRQQYSLNCILRSDQETHFATIKENYPPGGEYAIRDVQNAIVKLILPDGALTFKDSSLAGAEPPLVNTFYYLSNYNLVKGMQVKIEALLPDGKLLTATTQAPRYNALLLPEEGGGPTTIPDGYFGDTYKYTWNVFGNYEPLIFGPSFYIAYFISGSKASIIYRKVKGNHKYTNQYNISVESIDNAMQEIATGIDDKSTINIIGAYLEIKVFDKALGTYVNSIETFEDEYSIRISEPDISNIEGGFGIFGTYISEKFNINITSSYISSFGYTNMQ
jgi:hypothetical protein